MSDINNQSFADKNERFRIFKRQIFRNIYVSFYIKELVD